MARLNPDLNGQGKAYNLGTIVLRELYRKFPNNVKFLDVDKIQVDVDPEKAKDFMKTNKVVQEAFGRLYKLNNTDAVQFMEE